MTLSCDCGWLWPIIINHGTGYRRNSFAASLSVCCLNVLCASCSPKRWRSPKGKHSFFLGYRSRRGRIFLSKDSILNGYVLVRFKWPVGNDVSYFAQIFVFLFGNYFGWAKLAGVTQTRNLYVKTFWLFILFRSRIAKHGVWVLWMNLDDKYYNCVIWLDHYYN